MTIRISDGRRLEVDDATVELSADINGERLWFTVPRGRAGELRGEPFACCAIVPAMARGEPLVLGPELPISSEFLAGLRAYMDVMRFWQSHFNLDLRPVEVHATVTPSAAPGTGRGALFSGGVDGLFTLLDAREEIDLGVFVRGVDFQLDNPIADLAAARNRAWLGERGLPLVELSTNMRWVAQRLGVRWNSHNGACLTGCAHAIGLRRLFIASGHSWLCFSPGGSHPAIDPLLGGDALEVVHHGHGWMRWQKLERIAREPGALDLLRVCWQDKEYNCGTCQKCRLTIFMLMTLGLEASEFRFPDHPRSMWPGPITSGDEYYYALQSLALARRVGNNELTAHLEQQLRRHQWRETLKRLDESFAGARLSRLARRIRTIRGRAIA